jgi:AraC-like DNA-binding protein
MNLTYHNPLEESNINFTNFDCPNGGKLIKAKGLYKIIWAKEPVEKFKIDGCSFPLKKNQVVFCTPLNYIDFPKRENNLIGILFNREFYCIRDNDNEVSCNGFLFYGSSQPVVVDLNKKEQKDVAQIYKIFEEEFGYRDKSQGEMIRLMLKRLLIKSTRLAKMEICQLGLSQYKYDLIREFHILVEKNFKTYHQVKDYADFLNKSPKTIANLFEKYSEKTPLTIINERILLESRRLLLFSNQTAEEIAYELGFKEASHFSKFFKNNESCSPIAFKKSTLNRNKGKNIQL